MAITDRFNLLSPLRLADARVRLAGLHQATRGRLIVCLPDPLKRFLASREHCLIIEPAGATASLTKVSGGLRTSGGEVSIDPALPLSSEALFGPDVKVSRVLSMPRDTVLTRTVSLPAQVRSNLAQVIRYELDRLSPFQASDVLYDFQPRPGPKGAPRLVVDLAICRRDLIDAWLDRFKNDGAPIDRITWEGAWPRANLLPPQERPQTRLTLFSLNTLVWVAIAGLLAVAMLSPLWQRHWVASSLEDELRRVRLEVVAVDDLRQELERARLGSTAVLQQRWDEPNILVLLRELTDRIPDDTWIQTLDYNNGQVELRGESGQATALIGLLERAPGIDAVSFRSPVTQVPQTGKERFNISLRFSRMADE
ncbi:fimbrial assembly protein [Thiocapsa imhoffii]|uniref:Fimbrial assembly protein n=1 Tax=Thiocapsa imhoffii TaxID=382777 RepID=A0A9X0WIZ2_9GAMM|nr:PilN domain-containing protein [Thiocapsa imhoffii]MBK1644992.1 fimbrial assembly protein [Thiocapsa imhoffii]